MSGDIVCVAADANRAGTLGSIGAFISPDSSLKVNDFPAGTSFVNGSVTIDGVAYPLYNPAAGFPLNDLAAGQSVTVEFAVTVI